MHGMESSIEAIHRACFEVGIKFGSLYHQFTGTPVSPTSVASLEAAIAESIANQPYCSAIEVTIDREALAEEVDATHGYTELTGAFLDCTIEVTVDDVHAVATISEVDGYPEMQLTRITRG